MKKLKKITFAIIAIILLIIFATMGIKEIMAVSSLANNPDGYQVLKCATCSSGNLYVATTKKCDSCEVVADANSTVVPRTRGILGLSRKPIQKVIFTKLPYM